MQITSEKTSLAVPVAERAALPLILGQQDQTRRLIERELQVDIALRDNTFLVSSAHEDNAQRAVGVLDQIIGIAQNSLRGGRALQIEDVQRLIAQAKSGDAPTAAESVAQTGRAFNDTILVSERGKPIGPRTAGQKKYLEAVRRADLTFSIGPAGTGKCIAADSLVLTDKGLLEIGTLGQGVENDEYAPLAIAIQGVDGPEATSHVYNGGETSTLQITTRFGFSLAATPEHPLLTLDTDGDLKWKRADDLRCGDVVALARGGRLFGQETRVPQREELNIHDHCSQSVDLSELDESFAYMMGVLTGDGCLTATNRVILSSADTAIIEAFYALASRWNLRVCRNGADRPHDYYIGSVQLRNLLLRLGMSAGKAATKTIPHSILRAPQTIVAAFLRGLFDADGSAEKRDGVVSLSSVSEKLIRHVQIVLLNFGIVAARSRKRGLYDGQRHISHLLTLSGSEACRFHDIIGFALERKSARRLEKSFNTNIDVVPHVSAPLVAALKTATFSRARHKQFDDYRRGRRRPSYAKLHQLVGVLHEHAVPESALEPLRDLVQRNLLFLEIVDITPSRTAVYDLTVPGTHSFVANGFVNHNTYMAVAVAVAAFKAKQVSRILLTRPAVEAGERLGFLPGDLEAKIDPYLRPLYDALFDMIETEKAQKMFERRTIEIAPLAYMRGRTLNDSFIILDEAQNTTPAQMKMFLTRLGFGSKMVVTGDVTQTDLPAGQESGLRVATRILDNVPGIEIVRLGKEDVVRHSLVQRIIEAYEHSETH